ncbi:MAG TPA: hypothetical protein PKK61_06065 [Defluviitaleaceae bacterium]|nr:hypothetical protein [Defluviitaleaceae bacterium]
MTRLTRRIIENTVRKKGKEAAFMLAVFNVAILLAIQGLNQEIPVLLKLNILFILSGILLLEIRPWDGGNKQS